MLLEPVALRPGVDPRFRRDVLDGFAMRPQRAIPARWFYDRRGSELFEEITQLPEYYPTRTETALLARHCGEIGKIVGPGRAVVEFGSGSSTMSRGLVKSASSGSTGSLGKASASAAADSRRKSPEMSSGM